MPWYLFYVQEGMQMGQAALETALNGLRHVFLLPFFLAVWIIYDNDIGSFGRIYVS